MLFLLNILASLVSSSLFFHSLPVQSTGVNVRTVCQDSHGNMWFGGTDGITRYDGTRYTDFRYNSGGAAESGEDHIYRILCDSRGTVWATHLAGVSSYDAGTGMFRLYNGPEDVAREMQELSDGRFLVSFGYRLWLFDGASGSFSRDGIPETLSNLSISGIYISPEDGSLLLGSRDGRVFSASSDLKDVHELSLNIGNVQINCFLRDSPFRLLVGTEGNGLWEFSLSGEEPRHYDLDYVRSLCGDDDGALWIGTKNGLVIMRNGRADEYHHDYYDISSITHDSVLDIFRDAQGTMWLGTYYGGVCYCTSRPTVFKGMVSRPGDNSLNGNVISDIVEDSDGSLWIGTNSGGLNHLLPDGSFRHIKGLGDAWSDQPDIKSIIVSKSTGLIYIGADKGDLSILRPGSKRLQTLNSGIGNGSYALEEGSDGTLYVGSPDGLFRYDQRSGRLSAIPVKGVRSHIWALRLVSDGTLWIGQKFGAVAINPETGEEISLPEELADIRYVEDFLEDSAGRIWISSSDGLFCYSDGEVRSYTVQDGMPDNVVHGVEEDAGGRLWISTNKGLCRMDPLSGEKWIFTVADGLPGDRFTPYAHCRTRSGEMYFGGLSWIVHFNPDDVNTSYKMVSPVLSGIEVNGRWQNLSGSSVTLRPGDRDISLMFSAPDYLSGQNGHFFYTLKGEGIKDVRHEAGADRIASYHGLAHGRYTFLLEYRNSAGILSPDGLEFEFTIPPYWYETLAARVAFAVLMVLGFAVFVLWLLSKKKAEYRSEMEKVRNELLNEFSLEFVRIGANKSDSEETSVAKVFYKGDEEFMRKAMQVVKKNLDNAEFSVEALASAMNMSRSNLHIRSKALFGVSAHEFIKTVRFNEACRLLLEKKHSVAEISDMVGFATPSYFASAFHKFIGVTPTEYVRQNSPAG
ncbi:MAG: helix-turn-helix domain-containing protein [Bacteroidales bacterium]|nr:helix-turn-helix domain-containing protein [Bacteroidales bacterium]